MTPTERLTDALDKLDELHKMCGQYMKQVPKEVWESYWQLKDEINDHIVLAGRELGLFDKPSQ